MLWPENMPDMPWWLVIVFAVITETVIYYWLKAITRFEPMGIPESE